MKNLGFETQERVDVTESIKKEKTIPFINRKEALQYANSIRSYIYDLYCYTKKNGYIKREFYGYAVPK